MDATDLVWLCSCQFLRSLYIEDGQDGGAGMGMGGVSGNQVARLVQGAELRHLQTVALGFVSHQVLLVACFVLSPKVRFQKPDLMPTDGYYCCW